MNKTYRLLDANGSEWFWGTIQECDNCYGLRIDAEEGDVFSFAKSHDLTTEIYIDGILTETIKPADLVYNTNDNRPAKTLS